MNDLTNDMIDSIDKIIYTSAIKAAFDAREYPEKSIEELAAEQVAAWQLVVATNQA